MPPFVELQLATLVPQAPEGEDWVHELKFDGYRILARLDRGRVTLLSRRAKDWSGMFPGVVAAVAKLPAGSALIDGEVAVPLADGRTSFQALQNVLSRNGHGAVYYVFDLLHLDGKDLRDQPLEVRKQALKELVAAAARGTPVHFSDHVVGNGDRFFQQARARGLEGIVSKKRRDPYRSGRSLGWLKVKAVSRQEFVIGGYTEPEGSREALGALLIGYHAPDGKLMFAGKVGTGFTQKVLRDLRRRLGALGQEACPFAERPPAAFIGRTAHWTRPELVAEIAFIEWTHDGRLRHPSFQGLREDKPAREVIREAPIAQLADAEPPASGSEVPEEDDLADADPAAANSEASAQDDLADADSANGSDPPVSSKRRGSSSTRAAATAKRPARGAPAKKGPGATAAATATAGPFTDRASDTPSRTSKEAVRTRSAGSTDRTSSASRTAKPTPREKRKPASTNRASAPPSRTAKATVGEKHKPASTNRASVSRTAKATVREKHKPDSAERASRARAAATAKPRAGKAGEVEVLGQRLSHPDRVYYPEQALTKLDLAHYYEEVGEAMLPHVGGRPLSLVRCPEGLAGGCFYVKHMGLNVSPALDQIPIRESQKIGQYVVVHSVEGLVSLAQMGMLEIHTWNSTRDQLERPDRFVLDLDPGPEVPWPEVVQAARLCRSTLKELGLESFLKTTGGKGLHVVVPLVPDLDWDRCLSLSRAISELIVRQAPRRYTTAMPKAGRERKILIDYLRNTRGATSICAFSTRARPGATVSVPLAWDELGDDLRSDQLTVKTVPKRLRALRQDPWKRYFSLRQSVPPDLARLLRDQPG